jgi:CheY-like chemotaxis protein
MPDIRERQTLTASDRWGVNMPDLLRRALVADDSRVNRALVARVLEGYGYSVVLVDTGLKAYLEVQKQEFDLVLMDLQMPEMSGLDAAAAIRQLSDERFQHLPIVGMTAQDEPKYQEACLAHGMNVFIRKPIHSSELLDLLRKL